jgi:hypothetical protein
MAQIAPVAPARWRRFRLAETDASDRALAACHRLAELELDGVSRL